MVVSIGCPSGIGPEVSVAAAEQFRDAPSILVGDVAAIQAAAELRGVPDSRLAPYVAGKPLLERKIYYLSAGPELGLIERKPGVPSKRGGQAQLAYIDRAYDLAHELPRTALVTGPVSKLAIANSGARGARRFRGHTEWLQRRDGADFSVMCFAAEQLVCSLVTTHLPLKQVPRALTRERVSLAISSLVKLLDRISSSTPRVAVCSLNPHAGEGELLGREENEAIFPGIRHAQRRLRGAAEVLGPIGAETAFRKAYAGEFSGVVAMYHDQATIPMKLVAFGDAVNVTMGLSIVRTSVDHGTGYDIAGRGCADAAGMLAAMRLGAKLVE